ncbi:CheX protein [Jannaschia sp. CCS1]|nr:CheX protein [Jannaschia sp. CCS1]
MMTITYKLPGHLDSAVAAPLASELTDRCGQPICIDAGEVTFVGTLPLQILVAARKQWAEDEQSFQIAPLSQAFVASVEGLGVSLQDINATDTGLAAGEGRA